MTAATVESSNELTQQEYIAVNLRSFPMQQVMLWRISKQVYCLFKLLFLCIN